MTCYATCPRQILLHAACFVTLLPRERLARPVYWDACQAEIQLLLITSIHAIHEVILSQRSDTATVDVACAS